MITRFPEFPFQDIKHNKLMLQSLMRHVRGMIVVLGSSGNEMDVLSASSKVEATEKLVKGMFAKRAMEAFHDVKVDPKYHGKIDFEFLIDQHGFLGWQLVNNARFMEVHGSSNNWMRLSKADLREFVVKNQVSTNRNPKDELDDAFMVKFNSIVWLNEEFKRLAIANRNLTSEINMEK